VTSSPDRRSRSGCGGVGAGARPRTCAEHSAAIDARIAPEVRSLRRGRSLQKDTIIADLKPGGTLCSPSIVRGWGRSTLDGTLMITDIFTAIASRDGVRSPRPQASEVEPKGPGRGPPADKQLSATVASSGSGQNLEPEGAIVRLLGWRT